MKAPKWQQTIFTLAVTALITTACGGGSGKGIAGDNSIGGGSSVKPLPMPPSVAKVSEPNQSINGSSCANDVVVGANYGIAKVPVNAGSQYTSNFCKYTQLKAPNGKAIHFYAQARISNEQMLRAKRILAFYLENVSGSQYGADKTAVFNSMADNNATLIMLNGSDNNNPPADGQTLYETENIIEGSGQYFSGEPRDAAYEEILHLMHDTGIGVDGVNGGNGVLKATYQKEIRAAMQDAIPTGVIAAGLGAQKGLWAHTAIDWLKELAPENSLTQEYLASVIDHYYGLAGKASPGGYYDLYKPQSREKIKTMDGKGWALLGKYFNPYVTRVVRLSPDYTGTFEMTLDENKPYTWKSRFLTKVQLLGAGSASINGNALDNVFGGNAGNNRFDGKAGVDTVTFQGKQSEYKVTRLATSVVVTDSVANRDGVDTLVNVEKVQFSDGEMAL